MRKTKSAWGQSINQMKHITYIQINFICSQIIEPKYIFYFNLNYFLCDTLYCINRYRPSMSFHTQTFVINKVTVPKRTCSLVLRVWVNISIFGSMIIIRQNTGFWMHSNWCSMDPTGLNECRDLLKMWSE